MNKEIRYEITTTIDEEKWTLWSIVDTDFGTVPAKNFVFEGTLEECEEKMEMFKASSKLEGIRYVDHMTAKELIRFIANDPPELSHDKIVWQRNDFIKMCKRWIDCNENKD